MKHKQKHADLIHAWADGAKIETRLSDGNWHEISLPNWGSWDSEFRIKPEPDVITRIHVTRHNTTTLYVEPNLRLTFDGETGNLKSAEVLN